MNIKISETAPVCGWSWSRARHGGPCSEKVRFVSEKTQTHNHACTQGNTARRRANSRYALQRNC